MTLDLAWLQATTNMISLTTIACYAKAVLLQSDDEAAKKWPVLGLVASDCLMHVGYILVIGDASLYDSEGLLTLCKFQGFLIHFGMLASFMWINVIVLILHNSLTGRLPISRRRTAAVCFGLPLAYCLLFWRLGAFGRKQAHANYCGIVDSTLARLAAKVLPWIFTSCVQVYYMLEIYRLLKRKAVTLTEWRQVGKLLLFPLSVVAVYLFAILNFVLELYDKDQAGLLLVLVVCKNALAGLQGCLNCVLYGFDSFSLKVAALLCCISNRDDDPILRDEQELMRGDSIDSKFE